jgi:hypothetical protein
MDVLSQSCQMRCRVELGRVRLRHISSQDARLLGAALTKLYYLQSFHLINLLK